MSSGNLQSRLGRSSWSVDRGRPSSERPAQIIAWKRQPCAAAKSRKRGKTFSCKALRSAFQVTEGGTDEDTEGTGRLRHTKRTLLYLQGVSIIQYQ